MRLFLILAWFAMPSFARPAAALQAGMATADTATVRRELQQRYDENRRAFFAKDVAAIMALRSDGKVHHVETWVTQREIWRRTLDGWKLYRVDNVRDQRRLVDGLPG